jgi:hypothetical protein
VGEFCAAAGIHGPQTCSPAASPGGGARGFSFEIGDVELELVVGGAAEGDEGCTRSPRLASPPPVGLGRAWAGRGGPQPWQ